MFPLTGLQVFIHNQSEPPPVTTNGFFVTTGYYTYVAMTRMEHSSLEPPYDTMCGSIALKYHKEYNQKACLLELLTDKIGEVCHCRASYMPDNGTPLCSLRQLTLCVGPETDEFDSFEERKKCPNPCSWTTYNYELSYSSYLHAPPVGISINVTNQVGPHLLQKKNEMTPAELDEYIENNIILVQFFYKEMANEIVQQEPSFDFYQFLGDMGGEIGLMLGASLLTFVEFIDLFVFLVYHQLLRIYKAKKEDTDEEASDKKRKNKSTRL